MKLAFFLNKVKFIYKYMPKKYIFLLRLITTVHFNKDLLKFH